MEVAFEGFSIREYVSKVRSVDVAKCWPFDGEPYEGFLPPITVAKFSWWSNELGLVRVAEERELVLGESLSTRDVVEVGLSEGIGFDCKGKDDGNGRSHVKMRAKFRAPKKRSIVEIFAVAPQVESVEEDEDEEVEEDSSLRENEVHNPKLLALCDVSLDSKIKEKMKKKKKKKKKKAKLKDETLSDLKKENKLSKVKNKERDCAHQLVKSIAKNKEKPHKLKRQSQMLSLAKQNSSVCSEGLGKDIADAVSIREKKPTVKCLATQKKKLGKAPKVFKHKKSGSHVRGILKNHKKGFVGEHSASCNSQTFNHYSTPQSDRHVRFSDMNDIRGPRSMPSSECPKLQSVSSSNSNAFAAASSKDLETERGTSLTIAEVNESDEEDVSICTNNDAEVEGQPLSTRKSFDLQNFLKPPMDHQEHFSEGSVTVYQVAPTNQNFGTFNEVYRDLPPEPTYESSPRFPSLLKQRYDPVVPNQVCADIAKASNYMTDALIESHSSNLLRTTASACSLEYMKSSSRPSPSYFAMNGNENGQLPFPPRTTTVNYPNHGMQYQSFRHFTPKELMRSISSFPDWKQRAAMGEAKCVDQGFFGLPLNSQGELIPLNSSGTVTGSSYLALPSFTVRNNGSDLTKDQVNEFPVRNMKENSNFLATSMTHQSTIQDTGVHCFDAARESNQSVYHLESDLKLVKDKNIHHMNKQYNQVPNRIGDGEGFKQGNPNDVAMHLIQPTMRLMGKEFTVGRSSQDLQAFEDGKIWTDKQIIAEHRPSNTAICSSSSARPFPGSGKLKENVPCFSEFHVYQASQNGPLTKTPASMFSHPYHTHGSHVSTLHPYIPSSASPPLNSLAPPFQDTFTIGYESLKANSRIPMFASSPQWYTSHMTSKSTDLQNSQKLPHAMKSALEYPFLRPDCGEHVQPSWLQNPSTSLPPWLINATQRKETPIGSFHPYLDVGGRNIPSTIYGSNFQPYPHHPVVSDSAVKNSFVPPLMPLCHEFIPIPSASEIHGERMKFKERVSSQGKNSRKRAVARLPPYSPRPTKILNLTVKEGSGVEKTLKAGMAAVEQDSIRDKLSSTECGGTDIRITDEIEICGDTDIWTTDEIEKSGPIRLSAGAKHILKPSSDLNQDNSRPTFSSIPFAAATSSGRASESGMKSAQIYRF